ncbi:Glycosyl transferase family 2 [Roseivivax lentus]|uniref:Glycosyl transferase family 2 n=1 Tax=Roseivivax lentus TaxID=633194 RepID=A0A1N7LA75_9RHOB|nr:glycosyltransferase family 2 protein [Roseivivax lentus]SIS70699.1 Glycosyl transferase family 2 [Roseivivax lentus]
MTRWGIVATVKAPLPRLLDFAAWHLDLGASQLFLYLDDGDPAAREALSGHPRITVTETDAAYWAKKGGRPDAHQNRQCRNARHANNRKTDLDWLAHIDVDEFLLPEGDIGAALAALPDAALCARMRPVEALATPEGSDKITYFKAFHLDQPTRQAAASRIFGAWAQHLSGGFLSHVAGKLFFRAGTKGLQIRIHNVILDGEQNPGQATLDTVRLGHFHAASWEAFEAAYRFRLAHGSYRDGLNPQGRAPGALKLHDLFRQIEAEGGRAALRQFYEDVATGTPALLGALEREGLLYRRDMDLPSRVARHFPHCVGQMARQIL